MAEAFLTVALAPSPLLLVVSVISRPLLMVCCLSEYVCAHTHTHTHTLTHSLTHTLTHSLIYIYIYIQTYIFIYIYRFTCTYAHTEIIFTLYHLDQAHLHLPNFYLVFDQRVLIDQIGEHEIGIAIEIDGNAVGPRTMHRQALME